MSFVAVYDASVLYPSTTRPMGALDAMQPTRTVLDRTPDPAARHSLAQLALGLHKH
jgi:hypothetical protein